MESLVGKDVIFLYKFKFCKGTVLRTMGRIEPTPEVHTYVIRPWAGDIMTEFPYNSNPTMEYNFYVGDGPIHYLFGNVAQEILKQQNASYR